MGSQIDDDTYNIRPMRPEDIPIFCRLVNELQEWNTTVPMIGLYRELSASLYLVLEDSRGQLLSFCCGSEVEPGEVLIDYYVTKPEYRRRGLSRELFKTFLSRVVEKNVSLYTRPQNLEMYSKSGVGVIGFKAKLIRGKADYKALAEIAESEDEQTEIKEVQDAEIEKVLDFDCEISRSSRRDRLKKWLQLPGMTVLVALRRSRVVGYVCLFPGPNRYKVSRLFADNLTTAQQLWKTGIQMLPQGADIEIFVPAENTEATLLFLRAVSEKNRQIIDQYQLRNRPGNMKAEISKVYCMSGVVALSI